MADEFEREVGPPVPKRRPRAARRAPKETVRGRLKPHDPFELIRWLALSQPDPRKALAELVQNSLDAGASTIRVIRARHGGTPCLSIRDDGEGIIPEADRAEALRYIATHIGHSRKRALSPEERLRLMTQGQYGIGLLGFWSLGQMLEMRSSIPGQRPHRLILHRDRPDFTIEPLRGRLPMDERWTEVVVVGLHREALGALGGRRAADYLASELRGQILSRKLDLVVEDRMSRGRSQKMNPVRPVRFLGEKLEGLGPIPIPGHAPVRLEIYLAEGSEEGGSPHPVAIYASGTLVAESFHQLGHLDLDRAPWIDPRLTGLVDFPDFNVAPGNRRGLIADDAASSFARALVSAEPVLTALLEGLERRKADEIDRTMIKDLQRAFRDFYRQRPRYSMLPVRSDRNAGEAPSGASAFGGENAVAPEAPPGETAPGPTEAPDESAGDGDGVAPEIASLLPPGPLASVKITPAPIHVERLGTRRVRATPLDAAGCRIDAGVEYEWSLEESAGRLEPVEGSPAAALIRAPAESGEGSLTVKAVSEGRLAIASARVAIVEEILSRGAEEGIPDPELVDQPGATWRSRMQDGRWRVNVGHRDYRAIVSQPALKLRYLALLFAKEVVLRSGQDPRLESPLEQVVEVAAYADRNIGRGRSRAKRPEDGGAAGT